MARKTTAQAAPSGDPQAQHVPPVPSSETPPVPSSETPPVPSSETPPVPSSETPPVGPLDAEGSAVAAVAIAPAPADPPAPSDGQDALGRVRALVLHDSIYGKCGEVREFDAEHVPALQGAGYIDPHPKAVESAGG